MNNKKGITLIALVVTIVVLLILAGVSLSVLTGENGSITQAQVAKESNKKEGIKERVEVAAEAAYLSELTKEIKEEKFQEELDKMFGTGVAGLYYNSTTKEYTVTVEDYEVKVGNKAQVEEAVQTDIAIKLVLSHTPQVPTVGGNVAEVREGDVPIPTGFTYVEGHKDTGLVIKDAKENEFVWVPVKQNQKLTLEVMSTEEITGITLTGPDKTKTELTVTGTRVKQEIEMTTNGDYKVEVVTASGSKVAQKRITSLYAPDTKISKLEKVGTDNNQKPESVNKYGGYYIARYEAGDGTTTSARKDSTVDTNELVSKKGAFVYNWVDVETAKTLSTNLANGNTAITTQLATGAGWDRTLNWIMETGNKTESEISSNSKNWGNYKDSTGNAATNSGSNNMNFTTGRSEYWKANNIYDLAGNTREWTQEVTGTKNYYRGGHYGKSWTHLAAGARESHDPTYQTNTISFRVEMYINV